MGNTTSGDAAGLQDLVDAGILQDTPAALQDDRMVVDNEDSRHVCPWPTVE
jgi:hypothetical protein